MRRREFIALLGGATVLPLAAMHVHAQLATTPLVGFLNQGSAKTDTAYAEAFRKGLSEAGFAQDKNVTIDYRWADGQYERLPQLAADLVGRKAFVIAAAFAPATHAAIAASSTIPIVFVTGTDPVRSGFVSSFNRPGGKVTGFAVSNAVLGSKQLGLLHDILPAVSTVALLVNPANPFASETYINDIQTTALNLGLQIVVLRASTDADIDNAFATMIERRIGALMVAPDNFLRSRGGYIVAMTLRHAIPTIYSTRDFTTAGGLMSYDTDISDGFRQQGRYVGRILKGENVSELPVLQPTEFRFMINTKTAKALGLTIPPGVLAIADEVIE
jgi:putative tryptophan/tyrosine transport system substrate-binding protein